MSSTEDLRGYLGRLLGWTNTNAIDHAFLERAQQLGLQRQRHLGDFVKQQCAAVSRAEETFALLKDTSFALPALRALIRIYESEHDWPRAIQAVDSLRKLIDEPVPQLVHYHCELAQTAMSGKSPDLERAKQALALAKRAASALPLVTLMPRW